MIFIKFVQLSFLFCFRNSWAVFMLGGGHFAGAIFKGAEVGNFVNFHLCVFTILFRNFH